MEGIGIKGVETNEELQRATELMAQVHFQDSFEGVRWLRAAAGNYPNFKRDHTRIALLKGEIAGALRITSDTIRIGEARLKMGGLGFITTAPQYRHQGIARKLIEEALRYMREHGYHVSMLFGIPNFYGQFGFATAIAGYSTTIQVAEAMRAAHPPYRIRDGRPSDIPALQKLHEANDADTACSMIRHAAHISSKWDRFRAVRVLTNEQGKITAYFLPAPAQDELRIEEAGASDWAHCGAILHACAGFANAAYQARIRFSGPPAHPVIRHLLQYKSIHEMRITRDQGGMLAVVNLEETLESMIPEWERRIAVHAAAGLRTEITLMTDRRAIRIRANRGALDIAPAQGKNKFSLEAGEWIHLLTGYRYLDEVLSAHRRIITAEGRILLNAIFPKRTPYVWPVDTF